MEVASDNGMAPVTGEAAPKATDVGGLIAAVESKMSELMAWHAQQVKQLETDKTVLQATADKQQEQLASERSELDDQRQEIDESRTRLQTREADLQKEKQLLSERNQQIEQQRVKLVELTSKLRAEESAMSREWSEIQRERESIQRQNTELAEQRGRIEERAKTWLAETADQLGQPLKLTEHDDQASDSDQTHAA